MVTLATGPSGPSRASLLGAGLGGGFGQGFAPQFIKSQQGFAQQQKLNPIREALLASLGGAPTTPGQQLVQQVTSSPELFAQFMSDPQALTSLSSLTSAAQPGVEPTGTGFVELDEINRTFDLALEAQDAGETRRAGILFQRVNDLIGAEAAVDPDLDILQLIRSGTNAIETIQGDGTGNFFDVQGNEITLNPGDRILESATVSDTTEGALALSEKQKLDEAEISTRNFLGSVSDALVLLAENPDVNTIVARGAALLNDARAEAEAIAGTLGLSFDAEMLNPDNPETAETLRGLGVNNRRLRGLITSLAFQAAAAEAPGDRVTERDFQNFLAQIGGSANNANDFAAILRDVSNRSVRNFRTRARVLGEERGEDIILDELPGFSLFQQGAGGGLVEPEVPGAPAVAPVITPEIRARISNLQDAELLDFNN